MTEIIENRESGKIKKRAKPVIVDPLDGYGHKILDFGRNADIIGARVIRRGSALGVDSIIENPFIRELVKNDTSTVSIGDLTTALFYGSQYVRETHRDKEVVTYTIASATNLPNVKIAVLTVPSLQRMEIRMPGDKQDSVVYLCNTLKLNEEDFNLGIVIKDKPTEGKKKKYYSEGLIIPMVHNQRRNNYKFINYETKNNTTHFKHNDGFTSFIELRDGVVKFLNNYGGRS